MNIDEPSLNNNNLSNLSTSSNNYNSKLNKDSYKSNNSSSMFMDDDLCKSITTPSQRFSHRDSAKDNVTSVRLNRVDSSNSNNSLESYNRTKSSGYESSSVLDQNDELQDDRSITKLSHINTTSKHSKSTINKDKSITRHENDDRNDSSSPMTRSPMTKSPMIPTPNTNTKTTFSRESLETNTNLNTNDKYKNIYKITEENDLEDSDDFDDNRDITATDVRKKVDIKCKGWGKIKNTDDELMNSITIDKKTSKKQDEQFEGELGSIINEEAFRSTKIGFKATNKREFDVKFKNLEIDIKIGEGGEGEV